MPIKISHSASETFSQCGRKYFLQYKENLVPKARGSALFLGVSYDNAFNSILENLGKTNEELIQLGLDKFYESWDMQEDKKLGKIYLAKNPDILYSKKDFEEAILTEADGELIEDYFQEIKPTLNPDEEYPFETGYQLFQHLRELYKNFSYFTESDKAFYNYCCWLSLRRKAPLVIAAYVQDLVPHIEKVDKVQVDLSVKDEEGNEFRGIADFTVYLKPGIYGDTEVFPGELIIADNKSSSRSYLEKSYGEGSVRESSQLSKYQMILNEDGKNITKGAYFVFVKDLKETKNKTCKSCGHSNTGGQNKTCDARVGKKRCGGEWDISVTYSVETRLVVETISEAAGQAAMEKIDETIQNIKAEKFEPNWDSCAFQFGHPCPYQKYCQTGCEDGLLRVEKKK